MAMDYAGFVKEVYKLTNIDLNCYKEKQMRRRIESLIQVNNFKGFDDFVEGIKKSSELMSEFLNHITINVSEFYRNPSQWSIFESEILPSIFSKTRTPQIWSAACSTGDEPYTIAMILNKTAPNVNCKILATDIDKTILDKARAGIYTRKSVEGLPADFKQKHFEQNGEFLTVKNDIKKYVEFKHHNLLRDPYPQNLDLIVCRNVLIYFTEEAKDAIYIKFNKALKPGGKLFIGSTEQILYAGKYGLKPLKTFFYEKEKDLV